MLSEIWWSGHMAPPEAQGRILGRAWGRGPCPLPPTFLTWGLEGESPGQKVPGAGTPRAWALERLPPPAGLGHAWHAERGPVGSVCAPRAPIGMREPARRGREAGALAGGAGEAAAGHVLALSFSRGQAG